MLASSIATCWAPQLSPHLWLALSPCLSRTRFRFKAGFNFLHVAPALEPILAIHVDAVLDLTASL